MRLTTWLLVLAAAPLPGVILALADWTLGLGGVAVTSFVAVCVMASSALGAMVAIQVVRSLLRHDRDVTKTALADSAPGPLSI